MYRLLEFNFKIKEEFEGNPDEKFNRFETQIASRYEAYRYKSLYVGKWGYRIPENEHLEDFLRMIKPFDKYYDFSLWMKNIYEEKDYQEASAFLLDFPYGCDEYDNEKDLEELNTESYICNECRAVEKKEVLILEQDNDWIEDIENTYAGISTNRKDYVISRQLYDYLKEKNIDGDFFRPVYDINKTLFGYRLYGEKNILPQFSIVGGEAECYNKCEECGSVAIEPYWEWDLDDNSLWNSISAQYKIGSFSMSGCYNINKRGLKALKCVNLTSEYHPTNKDVIIDSHLYWLIEKKWPDIKQYVFPIFFKDFEVRINPCTHFLTKQYVNAE